MSQNVLRASNWPLLTGTSRVLFTFSKNLLKIRCTTTNRFVSTYEHNLRLWAVTGQQAETMFNEKRNDEVREDLKLIGAQIYFRHGARTPLHLLPTLEEVSYTREHVESFPLAKWDVKLITKFGNEIVSKDKVLSANDIIRDRIRPLKSADGVKVVTGQLTSVGEKQLYQLGQLIRKKLHEHDLISFSYDPTSVFCRASYMDRTIASARSFLSGLFTSNNQIKANGPFEIEVQHFLDEYLFPNPRVYPILSECQTAVELYQSLDNDHDLKKARQALIDRIGINEYRHGIVELYDDFASRKAHNFSIPQEFIDLIKNFDLLSAREFVAMGTTIGVSQFIRSTCGPLLYLMRENFESIKNNYLENNSSPYQKLFVYSGHDTTLIPLSLAFQIFNMRWPEYGAYILLKYYISKNNFYETFVTLDYAGELQVLPNCDGYYCPYSLFMNNLENYFEKPRERI